ncbi:cysteine proteinase [Dendrothele bispora CBS 962.96]|uniref:Cysteine proteinase n=1 Tax=Dendrothele bispora (strain CBS 962.96) TaxID=1314807 RepID=A0A4S8KYP2_DENBC|nr:cysteine proteinase [Dendrothele bispora CBS 962.96]
MPRYSLKDAQNMSFQETNDLFLDKFSLDASPQGLTLRTYKKLVQLHRSTLQVLDCLMQLPLLFSALKNLSRHHRLGETSLLRVLQNLSQIQQLLRTQGDRIKAVIWDLTEKSPEKAAYILNCLVEEATSQNLNFKRCFDFLRISDLRTLSPKDWLNRETINYFINKWCRNSDTLGLSTYWANTFLFEDKGCTKPFDKFDNNSKMVNDLKMSIQRRERDLDNPRWSKIYIPINNAQEAHWYCASIDFDQHTIEILDSWGPTFRTNQNKPLRQKKHTALLAVLMWVTERIAEYRGEIVVLARNPGTDWSCNPHVEVPLQPNGYDCGIHMLWHLYHIGNFGSIKQDLKLPAQHRFTENMVGKRLRLAQEILDQAGFRF